MPENGCNYAKDSINFRNLEELRGVVEVLSAEKNARLEVLLDALEERMKLQFFLTSEAYKLRNEQVDKRLDVMNEFRGALIDRESSYFTRQEHEVYAKSVDSDLRLLRENKADAKLVESDLRVLRESRAMLDGKASQANMNVTFAIAMIGSAMGLIGLIMRLLGK